MSQPTKRNTGSLVGAAAKLSRATEESKNVTNPAQRVGAGRSQAPSSPLVFSQVPHHLQKIGRTRFQEVKEELSLLKL